MLRRLLLAVGLIFLAVPSWAQFVAPGGTIPVIANLSGKKGTFWRSDVSVLNLGDSSTSIVMQLYPEIVNGAPSFEPKVSEPIAIAAGQQLVMTNIMQSKFGLINVKGALMIYSTDGTSLVIASRTYTNGSSGTYGQDVSSILVDGSAWVAGVEDDSLYRTNLGIFWPWDESVQFTVEVYSADGQLAGSGQIAFSQPGLQQKGLDAFNVGFLPAGYIVITCSDSQALWYAYGTTVDQSSGDAVYRPARGHQIAGQ